MDWKDIANTINTKFKYPSNQLQQNILKNDPIGDTVSQEARTAICENARNFLIGLESCKDKKPHDLSPRWAYFVDTILEKKGIVLDRDSADYRQACIETTEEIRALGDNKEKTNPNSSSPENERNEDLDTQPSIPEERSQKIRILVAEDNLIMQKLTVTILERLGYQAEIAANGHEVLKSLESTSFNLIIMDCEMPQMDGYKTTKCIREWRNSKNATLHKNWNMPIIAMTGHTLQDERDRCIASGMDDFISKPAKPQRLGEMIEKLLTRSNRSKTEPTTVPNIEESKRISVLDLQILSTTFLDKKKLLRTLMEMFLNKTPPTLKKLRKALIIEDNEQISFLAHKLAGTASTLGATIFTESVHALGNASKKQDHTDKPRLMARIETDFDILRLEIDKVLDNIGD